MTPEQIKKILPQASPSFLKANLASGDTGVEARTPILITAPTEAGPSTRVPLAKVNTTAATRPAEKLNKTEAAFYRLLKARNHPVIGVQDTTLKLGQDCRYTPDFRVIGPNDEVIFYEVKGFMREDALVKLKVAARQFREYQFYLVRKTKGGFEETLVKQ